MPNHIHLILRVLGENTVASVMRDFERHRAKQIIHRHQAKGNHRAWAFLERAAESERRQQHKVWADRYDARNVYTPNFLRQKAEYIHQNPHVLAAALPMLPPSSVPWPMAIG